MVQPIFPGVGTRSRIAQTIQADNELQLRQEALNRQSGQDLLGLGVGTALSVGQLVEQAERAARERELRQREGELDRVARLGVTEAQIAGRADVAGIGAASSERIQAAGDIALGERQGISQKFLGGESGLERAARLLAQTTRGRLDVGLEASRRAGALDVAEEGTFGRLAAAELAGGFAETEGRLGREATLAQITARGVEARALSEVQQAGSVVLQGMQDLAANQRLIATLDSRIELAIVSNDLAEERQLQAERSRLVEIDAQRASDVSRFASQFLLEDTARGDPIRRMEDRAFIAEDTNRRGEAAGTIAPGSAAIKTAAEIEQMVLDDPETAALSEIMRPHLQRALNRQSAEQDTQVPAAQRAAERRSRADFIGPGVLPGVPETLGPFIGPPTGNVGLGPSLEGRRREASITERLDPLTGVTAPLPERETTRRGVRDLIFGAPQRTALPGRVGTPGINTIRAGGETLLDFLQGTIGMNPDASTVRNLQPTVSAASPGAKVVVRNGEIFLVLPGGQIVPIPEAPTTPVNPRTGFRGQQFRGR